MEQLFSEAKYRRAVAEEAVRRHVMLNELADVQQVLNGSVGARLAAQHYQLMTSASPVAFGSMWRARADDMRAARERARA